MDWHAFADCAAGAGASLAPEPAAATTATLPAVQYDRARLLPHVATWLDAVLTDPVGGVPHPWRRALEKKLKHFDDRLLRRLCGRHVGEQWFSRENFMAWGIFP